MFGIAAWGFLYPGERDFFLNWRANLTKIGKKNLNLQKHRTLNVVFFPCHFLWNKRRKHTKDLLKKKKITSP